MEKIKDVYHNKLKVSKLASLPMLKGGKVYADRRQVKLLGKTK